MTGMGNPPVTPYTMQYWRLWETFGKDLVSVSAVARYLKMDARTVEKSTDFPVRKIGGRYMVNLCNLAQWMVEGR